jgi:hypothetical protein
MNRKPFLAALTLGAALLAASAVFAADKVTNASSKDEGQFCIPARNVDKVIVLNDYGVVYEMKGGDLFLNTFEAPCAGLSAYNAFTTEFRNPYRLCHGDNLVVSLTGSYCPLRSFNQISKDTLKRLQYAVYLDKQRKAKEKAKDDAAK